MKQTLTTYINRNGQAETARRLGVTPGAVWQMLKNKRNIFVIEHDNKRISAVEEKQIIKPRRYLA